MILVHSPKGGSGTTTLAANLGLILARRGFEVTLADITGQGTLGLYMGGNATNFERASANDQQTVVLEGVRVVTLDRARVAPQVTADVLACRAPGKLLIVDIGSSDRALYEVLLPLATLRLCVLIPEPGALATLPRAMGDDVEKHRAFFVLNQIDDRQRLRRDITTFMRGLFGDKLIGAIRRDEAVPEAAGMMEALRRYAPPSAALADFEALAGQVMDRFALTTTRSVA